MNQRVLNLANRMRLKKANDEKFVLILGAGASIPSGVKPTQKLMEELLALYGKDLVEGKVEDRFDKLWKRTGDDERLLYLKPYLSNDPSPGYAKLANLIEAGYFDLALTFNFDDLVETSLDAIGFKGLQRIIRGETVDDQMAKLIQTSNKPFKLVKLHGSLTSTNHFFFDVNEMFQYPEPIKTLVANVTSRDLIMCGYAFRDFCVLNTFAKEGGSIVCVNPAGVPDNLRGFLKPRRSEDMSIDVGFDDFFDELHKELLTAPAPKPDKARPNPFKFLESYEVEEHETFKGRQHEIAEFKEAMDASTPPRVLIVAGPAKSGKTSLVKAGLIPALDEKKYAAVYTRCREEMEKALPALPVALWPDYANIAKMTLPDTLKQIANMWPDKRIVLFLDQFDRVAGPPDHPAPMRAANLTKTLAELLPASEQLTLALVVVDDAMIATTLYPFLSKMGVVPITVRCELFEKDQVSTIIRALATQGGLQLEDAIVDDLVDIYEKKKALTTEQRFTLAHIQAICHILAASADGPTIAKPSYTQAFNNNLSALHQAINACDFISFVEDLAWSDAVWFRNMLNVPLKESKERIARFIKDNYRKLPPPKDAAKTDYRMPFDARGAKGRVP
jgi:hypothetical protein